MKSRVPLAADTYDRPDPHPCRPGCRRPVLAAPLAAPVLPIGIELAECDLSRANPWVRENVIPHLTGEKHPRYIVAKAVYDFMGERPEMWAYYGAYDWVALCQLFGTMMDLPPHWPMFCRDVTQLADSRQPEPARAARG